MSVRLEKRPIDNATELMAASAFVRKIARILRPARDSCQARTRSQKPCEADRFNELFQSSRRLETCGVSATKAAPIRVPADAMIAVRALPACQRETRASPF
jgi:hypothetical protein